MFSLSARAADVDATAKRLEKVCRDMRLEGVTVMTSGRIVFVDGTVQVPTYVDRIAKVLAAFRQEAPELVYQNLVTVDPQAWVRLAERVEREIGSPEITARVVGKAVYLEGVADSDFEADRGVQIARTYLGASAARGTASTTGDVPNDYQIVDLLRVRPAKKAVHVTSKNR